MLIVATEGINKYKGYKEIYQSWKNKIVTIMNAENTYSDSWIYPDKFTLEWFNAAFDIGPTVGIVSKNLAVLADFAHLAPPYFGNFQKLNLGKQIIIWNQYI